MYRIGPGQDVLCRVKNMAVPACMKKFFFKLHSGTLLVKTWMAEKGLLVPWTTISLLCKKPETIDHVFLDCWDAVFFWDVLQRTLEKDLSVTPYGIRFIPVDKHDSVPYDMIVLLGLHAIWLSRMAVRHSDADTKTVSKYFAQNISMLKEVINMQCPELTWLSILEKLSSFDVYDSFRLPRFGEWVLNRH